VQSKQAKQAVSRRVAVAGLGYVGCVSAACLAHLGHRVIGVDRDEHKVESVNQGRAPFYEPGLEELIHQGVAGGRLRATVDLAAALAESDIVLICVGTPSEKTGKFGLEQLKRVCQEIAATLAGRSSRLIVAVRSTVYPGTCEEVVAPLLGDSGRAVVVDNPEFLREGNAVKDFLEPSLLVVGGEDEEAVEAVVELYAGLNIEPCRVSTRTAEMIKYACNSFHAVKVAFANEIGTLCERMGVAAHEVMETFCKDTRLNISSAYLRPGFAFGGSCLPKDLRALTFQARLLGLNLPLLESVLPANAAHLQRAIDAVLELPAQRLGIYGLAFKENTDDLRESPVVTLLEHLIGKGRAIRVYDPQIRLEAIYGSNRHYVLQAIPHISKLMCSTLTELLDWADYVVVAQRPAAAARQELLASGLPILDLVGAFPMEKDAARRSGVLQSV
jgi:GDP-mannose 6-dehydrogenase